MRPRMTGVLLLNLGTPDAPRAPEVRRYLREFLSDPRVIDINPIGKWLLLNLVILRVRPKASAEAYALVWDKHGVKGSPLLHYGEEVRRAVAARLDGTPVALAMRYGRPSISAALDTLREAGAERLVVCPLYPQYAASTTGSSLAAIYESLAPRWNTPPVVAVPPFYDDPIYVGALAAQTRPVLDRFAPNHVLMSFHGLPERHIHKSDESRDGARHCLVSDTCCDDVVPANRMCYRAQCLATARGLAEALAFEPTGWSVSFQSRLGRTPWIRPYTDESIEELARRGVKRLAVCCPAFVADCLETIEEIGMRGREIFLEAGGEAFELVPCLNDHPAWIDAVVDLIRQTTRWI